MPVMGVLGGGGGRLQRSSSVGRGDEARALAPVQPPRRAHSFRSCLKKPEQEKDLLQTSGGSSRRSSGSRAVMFSDEIGEDLVMVNKFDSFEPVNGQPPPSEKRVPPVRNEKWRGSQADQSDRRKKMRNTEDDDTDGEVEDIDLDHYKDDPRLKIFGNPTVKKTQSFSHKKGTPVYEAIVSSGCQTPSNTPHSSSPLSTSPISSPTLNPRQMAVALALQQRGLSKSESCSGMPTKTTGSKPRSDSPLVLGFVRPEVRPTIVLTSPQESPEIGAEAKHLPQCLINLPDVSDKSCEEELIMSMETEEEKDKQTSSRLDQLSASITEFPDMEEYSSGLRERVRVPAAGGGGGVDQRSKRKIGVGNGPPPPPPKSAPPPLPIQIL